ncbi:hypothetical protein Tco_0455805, partial [Tanacetum coccineum]
MCTYLKNMEGWKPKSLKNKSFANIQELFDKAMERVNTFVDYRTELVEESSKKAKTELVEESPKKAEAEIAHESIPNDGDDVTIDATPLSTKSPTIVDYKIYKEGKKSYFQIIRADVKARFKKTEPVNYMDNFLLLNLKTMFKHHVEDNLSMKKLEILKKNIKFRGGLLGLKAFLKLLLLRSIIVGSTWITNEIKKSEAYQMYFKYSTGLIPPKKSRGKAVKEGKTTATTQKLTKPKKKPSKERQVLHDESPESEGEPENRKVSIKIRTPRAVVIQEPPAKKTQESSEKLKGI